MTPGGVSPGLNRDQTLSPGEAAVIDLRLHSISRLFSFSADASPFSEPELDPSVAEWISSSAAEAPRRTPFQLVLHLQEATEPGQSPSTVQETVRAFFARKAQLSRRELSRTLRSGRTSVVIGISFLCLTLAISKILDAFEHNRVAALLRESLIVAGWVAMWRPLEFLLYDWWPIRNQRRIYDRLSRIVVTVHQEKQERSPAPIRAEDRKRIAF